MSVFVDTSCWYAAADRGDQSNRRAKDVLSRAGELITSDHVLVETWLLLRHRLGRDAADRFWSGLIEGVAAVEPVIWGDLQVARTIGEEFADQDFSLVDCTSFALMRRLGLERAASFDADFAIFRYGTRRERAFTILS
ncbi:MAG: PIN domain-containing protein [Candidatus Dormibacteraeota bacterium]|nr:PIN domain-containing protein [Candidatus Dormibacteraeota bacterium]